MAAAEALEPESSMNREDLYDALVGVCQQVGITAEATYESPHDAMDSSRMSPTKSWSHAEVYGHDEGYESRCRWRGNHEHRGARLARKSLAPLSHVRMEAKRRALDEIATPRVQPTRSARRKRNGTHRRSMRRWRSSRFAGNRCRAAKPIWIRRCSDGLLGAVPGSVSGTRDTD